MGQLADILPEELVSKKSVTFWVYESMPKKKIKKLKEIGQVKKIPDGEILDITDLDNYKGED